MFKYNLHLSVRSYMRSLPAGDKLESDGQGSVPTMSAHSFVRSGSGKDGEEEPKVTLRDVVRLLATMEAVLHPLQPLWDQVPQLTATLAEQGQQQIALLLALTHVENTLHNGGGGLPARRRVANDNEAGASDDGGAGGGGTTHKLEFPKFDGKGNPLP
jgi:hypothetical protein